MTEFLSHHFAIIKVITDAGEDHQGIKKHWVRDYWGIGCSHDLKYYPTDYSIITEGKALIHEETGRHNFKQMSKPNMIKNEINTVTFDMTATECTKYHLCLFLPKINV